MHTALRSILDMLRAEWAHLPGGARETDARMAQVAEQFAACAAAMRRKIGWNLALARRPEGGELPPIAAYVRGGAVSIGMPAVAATFEDRPRRAWWQAQGAIEAGGRIVRLTNDLHTYFADAAEGKVTSITIRLRELGFPTTGLDPETSAEVRQAQEIVCRDLTRAVDDFGDAHGEMADGPLGYCMRHAAAFALAVYGDGSRFSRKPPA